MPTPSTLSATLSELLRDVTKFAKHLSGLELRNYQTQVAQAILNSIIHKRGDTIVIMFPRQSGKNELQAQIETYIMVLLSQTDAELVKVSPTWKPQSLNAMRRLERVLNHNLISKDRWKKEAGYSYRIGSARIFFLSGEPHASTVGHTANVLLQCDEAQDVQPTKWDKDFLPMAASTNATRVLWGTAWTSKTLLARELRAARAAEGRDGRQRTFILTADDVAREVPTYGKFVAEQVAKLGRNHPLVKTQYYSEEIDDQGGLFPAARRTLMRGAHGWRTSPEPGKIYAFLLDVAGEDETADTTGALTNPGRDSTTLTIVEVNLATVADELIHAPSYLTTCRYSWVGIKHPRLYGQLKALATLWNPRWFVADATGVGAGLVSFLDKALPGIVIPFIFNSSTKSALGWAFLGVIESGRYHDHTLAPAAPPDPAARRALREILCTRFSEGELATTAFDLSIIYNALNGNTPTAKAQELIAMLERRGDLHRLLTYGLETRPDIDWTPALPADSAAILRAQAEFWQQLEFVEYTAGTGQTLHWSVPNGTRDPATGQHVHDDWIMSAALCSELDKCEWGQAHSAVIRPADPMQNMGEVY